MQYIPCTTHEEGDRFTAALWALIQEEQNPPVPRVLTSEHVCVSRERYLNMPFRDSVKHHLTDTLLIHIPNYMHQYISHNRKTGKGMAVINLMALWYLEQSDDEMQYLSNTDIKRIRREGQ